MGRIWRRALAAAVLVVPTSGAVLVVSAPAAHAAAIIHVPGDQSTIQGAINAAAPGDTVEVSPGTYLEHIDFKGKAIEVRSTDGSASTTIDGGGAGGRVVTFANGEGRSAVLRGFTITHGTESGIGVYSTSPTIVDNRIADNATCDGGGGIYSSFGSPRIEGNVIVGNYQAGCSGGIGGGGIAIGGASAAEVVGNQIINNRHGSVGGGITLFASGHALVQNNVIKGNSANGTGGGMWIVNDSPASIVQNLIVDNAVTNQGGGVYVSVPSGDTGATFLNNTIARNTASAGRALFAEGFASTAQMINNVFAATSGPAVTCSNLYSSVPPMFSHNIAFASTGATWSGCDPTGTSGNLTADPAFVDPVNDPGSFRLSAGSPAVDAGDNSPSMLPASDLDGHTRIADGNGDLSAVVDMGAYELVPAGTTSTSMSTAANPSILGSAVALTATVTNASGADTPSGSVQFKDGSTDLGAPQPVAPTSTPGTATATLSTSSLGLGSHTLTAVYSPVAPFLASSSGPVVQQVTYGIKLLYSTTTVYKIGNDVHIKLQLTDASATNLSSASISVTAACVAPAAATTCSDAGAVPINKPFTFHKDAKGQSFYDYPVMTKGLAPGNYVVIFTALNDPVAHRAPLSLKK